MDLICILYSWWEGFGSSSLATLPLERPGLEAAAWVTGVLAAPGTQLVARVAGNIVL